MMTYELVGYAGGSDRPIFVAPIPRNLIDYALGRADIPAHVRPTLEAWPVAADQARAIAMVLKVDTHNAERFYIEAYEEANAATA